MAACTATTGNENAMMTQGFNFTERVRKVLADARLEALELRHEYVGTEHLLLALLREQEGVASVALDALDVRRDHVIDEVRTIVRRGHAAAAGPDLPYTSRAKKVLELAMSEARVLGHTYVGSEHLLVGLVAEDKGIGAQVLRSHGVTLERARAEVVRLLSTDTQASAPTDPQQTMHPGAAGYARSRSPYGVAIVEDFTGRARDALRAAYDEANSRNHGAVELSHVLLALASREDGMAAVLLDQVVGSRQRLVEAMVERLPDKEKVPDRRPIQLSDDTQHALDDALIEASKDGHRRAGTQHLLLATLDVLPLALAAACAQLGLSAKATRLVYERMRE
jgi:ATP-dependent Clp protease ATP-binding subunit ClpC